MYKLKYDSQNLKNVSLLIGKLIYVRKITRSNEGV